MRAVVESLEYHSETIVSLHFTTKPALRFEAGQFVDISLQPGVRHWFTLSSSPHAATHTITTVLTTPLSDFKRMLKHLKPGDTFSVSEPMGDFVLPLSRTTPLFFVCGGIGITPLLSMIRAARAASDFNPLHVIHSVRSEDEAVFTDEISKVASVTLHNSSKAGRLAAADILKQFDVSSNAMLYISGPESMVESLYAELRDIIPPHRLVTDYFLGYGTH